MRQLCDATALPPKKGCASCTGGALGSEGRRALALQRGACNPLLRSPEVGRIFVIGPKGLMNLRHSEMTTALEQEEWSRA